MTKQWIREKLDKACTAPPSPENAATLAMYYGALLALESKNPCGGNPAGERVTAKIDDAPMSSIAIVPEIIANDKDGVASGYWREYQHHRAEFKRARSIPDLSTADAHKTRMLNALKMALESYTDDIMSLWRDTSTPEERALIATKLENWGKKYKSRV